MDNTFKVVVIRITTTIYSTIFHLYAYVLVCAFFRVLLKDVIRLKTEAMSAIIAPRDILKSLHTLSSFVLVIAYECSATPGAALEISDGRTSSCFKSSTLEWIIFGHVSFLKTKHKLGPGVPSPRHHVHMVTSETSTRYPFAPALHHLVYISQPNVISTPSVLKCMGESQGIVVLTWNVAQWCTTRHKYFW